MGSRDRSIRHKIFFLLLLPLLSLSALWGFSLNLTIGDGLALQRAAGLYETIGVTSTELGLQIQAERTASVAAQGIGLTSTSDLAAARSKTDQSLARFRAAAESDEANGVITPELRTPLTELLRELERLDTIRSEFDSARLTRLSIMQNYNEIMDAVFRLYDRLISVPDLGIFQQAVAMQAMGNAREYISRQNALISGTLTAVQQNRLSEAEHNAFSDWTATRRHLHRKGQAVLDDELRQMYEEVFTSPTYQRYMQLEDLITGQVRPNRMLPEELDDWRPITNKLAADLDQVGLEASNALADRAASVAVGITVRIIIAGGIGLLAVVASIILSIRFGRRLSGQLAALRDAALDLAETRLPKVVERIRSGQAVDLEAEAPPIEIGGSAEVTDVSRAFGSVQRAAVESAAGQAALRRGVNQTFLNLSRRKQSMLQRQAALLAAVQRRIAAGDAHAPENLADLARLDHLTTRMRRHAETLVVLAGTEPTPAWREPVPVAQVLQAAVDEVEDYTRVETLPLPDTALLGSAVPDLTHLIAELIENATIFSPPKTTVQVRGEIVANGFAIEIEDRGMGLAPEEYESLNRLLADPPELDLTRSDRLGLLVVGRLAARHGISVVLRNSPYGGTTAIALLPRALVVSETTAGTAPMPVIRAIPAGSAGGAQEPPASPAVNGAAPESPEKAAAPTDADGPSSVPSAPPASPAAPALAQDVPWARPASSADADGASPARPAAAGEPSAPARSPLPVRRSPARPAAPAPASAVPPARPPLDGPVRPAEKSPAADEPPSPFFTPAARRTEPVPSAVRDDAPTSAPRQDVPDPATREDAPAAVPQDTPAGTEPAAEEPSNGKPTRPDHRRSVVGGTHAGLPRRIRQASLAPQLRDKPQPLSAPVPDPAPSERSPDEARAIFSAFQQGLRRGRQDTAHDLAHQNTAEKGEE